MEVRGVWSEVDFVVFFSSPLFSSQTLFPWWTSAWEAWLSRHDSTFRPNPHLVLHAVMMAMESEKVIERETQEGGRERESVKGGIVEMSRQVRMHWFRITFLFHFNGRMLPFRQNAILISRLRPNICTIQIGGYGGNAIQTWNMALSSYPAQPYWCFFEPFIAQPKWSLSGPEPLTD